MSRTTIALLTMIFCSLSSPVFCHAADEAGNRIRHVVDDAVRPVMAKDHIPGMAVGVAIAGKEWIFNYGVASTETGKPVTNETLFEVGSVTKTFTATLASWAQVDGRLTLSDKVGKYLPSLRTTPFGNVTVLNLGTHTPGGLPLQMPAGVRSEEQFMQYLKTWRPSHPPGTYRTYSNPGVSTLGLITAKAMGQDFTVLMEQRLFPALRMKNSFIDIPPARMADYAQGYTSEGNPTRMSPGVLFSEAYGIKSTAPDLIRFVEANMNLLKLEANLQRAIIDTHTGYFKAGVMTQDLIWEQYPYPVSLKNLLEGNSSAMLYDATPVSAITPSLSPQEKVWINKTGSTNGFATYVAFIPEKRVGIVILANRSFPIDERVTMAYQIVQALGDISRKR